MVYEYSNRRDRLRDYFYINTEISKTARINKKGRHKICPYKNIRVHYVSVVKRVPL
jgi:hypothetical protein